jgi:hypothetical protein
MTWSTCCTIAQNADHQPQSESDLLKCQELALGILQHLGMCFLPERWTGLTPLHMCGCVAVVAACR